MNHIIEVRRYTTDGDEEKERRGWHKMKTKRGVREEEVVGTVEK